MTANGRKKEALTAETFMDRVEVQVGCWLWTGNLSNAGYGRWGDKFAHRLSYELYKGSIPVGMEVDHLCFNPACVRPDHLQLLDPLANNRRKLKALAQECGRGHKFTPENTLIQHGSRRRCRTCENDGQRRRYWQRQAAKGG